MRVYEIRDAFASLRDAIQSLDALGYYVAAAYVSHAIEMIISEERKVHETIRKLEDGEKFRHSDMLIERMISEL
jgi:hypothetical protein